MIDYYYVNLTFRKSFFFRLDLSPLSKFIDDITTEIK